MHQKDFFNHVIILLNLNNVVSAHHFRGINGDFSAIAHNTWKLYFRTKNGAEHNFEKTVPRNVVGMTAWEYLGWIN